MANISEMSVVGKETVVIAVFQEINTEWLRLMRKYNDPFPRALITRKNNQSRRQNNYCYICFSSLHFHELVEFWWCSFFFFFMHFADNSLLSVKVDVIWQPFTLLLIQPQTRDNTSIGYQGNRAGNRAETKLSFFSHHINHD